MIYTAQKRDNNTSYTRSVSYTHLDVYKRQDLHSAKARQKKHKLHKITAHTVQNNGTQKCTQKQTCIIPNRVNTHKTQQSTMYNNSPVTEPNTITGTH